MKHTDNMSDITGNVKALGNGDALKEPELAESRPCDALVNAAGQAVREKRRVLIVGAGAAGLMAAISAADCGAKVTVLEHKDKPGIKLAITGNGRCNYTNTDVNPDKYHCDSAASYEFVKNVLGQFGFKESISFFKSIGIEPEIRHYSYDESGYVYPEDMDAQGFRDMMYKAALERGVTFHFGVSDAKVIETILNNTASTLSVDSAVIIATGSNAYPITGSDSSIYPVFKQLGIKTERFLPALCALYSKDEYLKEMKGRRVKTEARLTVYGPALETYCEAGEIQFNEHSISGIPVMQLSRYAARALNEGKEVMLSVDGHDYEIHRTAGFDRSQTCTGGIPAVELDPHTMKHRSGLYFCGEIIDIDGKCGGYNLQFAWSTGFIAGRAAARASVYASE